jgi:hypothetical protein
LRADLTKELRTAIATAQIENAHIGAVGIGVPLVDKEMTAATAHVLPLANARSHATHPEHMPTAAVFVARATASPLTDIRTSHVSTASRLPMPGSWNSLSPAQVSPRRPTHSGSEATARTHRNHIFTKTGVSRRTDLLALITRLVPLVRRPYSRRYDYFFA